MLSKFKDNHSNRRRENDNLEDTHQDDNSDQIFSNIINNTKTVEENNNSVLNEDPFKELRENMKGTFQNIENVKEFNEAFKHESVKANKDKTSTELYFKNSVDTNIYDTILKKVNSFQKEAKTEIKALDRRCNNNERKISAPSFAYQNSLILNYNNKKNHNISNQEKKLKFEHHQVLDNIGKNY